MKTKTPQLTIIGIIHSPYHTLREAPSQGGGDISEIEIYPQYAEGLTDISGFTHLHIYYWLHQSSEFSLMVHTPWDHKPHGVFTTRSPHRPNPIGHSIVELIQQDKNMLKVRGLDAIEGTPVLDIKPYIKRLDSKQHVQSGWIDQTQLK